jgi:hypothetical protein
MSIEAWKVKSNVWQDLEDWHRGCRLVCDFCASLSNCDTF